MFRTQRLKFCLSGLSVYEVTTTDPPPDGYDSGRNLLAAALIGPSRRPVGYVVGGRGHWCAYPPSLLRDFSRAGRRLPICQIAPRETVALAVEALGASCPA